MPNRYCTWSWFACIALFYAVIYCFLFTVNRRWRRLQQHACTTYIRAHEVRSMIILQRLSTPRANRFHCYCFVVDVPHAFSARQFWCIVTEIWTRWENLNSWIILHMMFYYTYIVIFATYSIFRIYVARTLLQAIARYSYEFELVMDVVVRMIKIQTKTFIKQTERENFKIKIKWRYPFLISAIWTRMAGMERKLNIYQISSAQFCTSELRTPCFSCPIESAIYRHIFNRTNCLETYWC